MLSFKPLKVISVALGLSACALPHVASAQQNCITRVELSAAAVYAVPGIIQGVQLKCGTALAAGGFLKSNGQAFSARYAQVRVGLWPEARSGALKYLTAQSAEARQNVALIANLPEATVQPLLDAMIAQETSKRINTADCKTIDLTFEALASLDPLTTANLLGLAAHFIAKNDPLICALEE